MTMTSAITINQLLSLPAIPETGFLFQDSALSGVLSEEELAAIHGGCLPTFEQATLLIGDAAVIVAGGGVLAGLGWPRRVSPGRASWRIGTARNA